MEDMRRFNIITLFIGLSLSSIILGIFHNKDVCQAEDSILFFSTGLKWFGYMNTGFLILVLMAVRWLTSKGVFFTALHFTWVGLLMVWIKLSIINIFHNRVCFTQLETMNIWWTTVDTVFGIFFLMLGGWWTFLDE